MRAHIFRAGFIFIFAIATFGYFGVSDSNAAACTITGQAYRDMDANGQDDGGLEPGVAGITVTAYDAAGNFATVVTGADGSYTFTPADLAPLTAGELRVEFTGLPGFLQPGPSVNNLNGGSGDSTVIFVDCSGTGTVTGVSTALANPADFCGDDPTVGAVCYVFGNQTQDATAFVTFPYESGITVLNDNEGVEDPPYAPEAQDLDIGSVWGMAYQPASDSVFLAAFMKRHVGFLEPTDDATGTIFRIDRTTGNITEFLNLNDLFGDGTTGANPHPFLTNTDPPTPNFEDDQGAGWDDVGKIAFGDLQLSHDQRTLYVVNLFDRSLYSMPIGTNDPFNPYGPVAPAAGQIGVFPMNDTTLPGLPCAATWDTDLRPGALGIYNNELYVGVLCSAESTVTDHDPTAGIVGDVTALEALVYRFDGATFTQVASFGLDYPRGEHTNGAPASPAEWLPWKNEVNGRAAPFGQVVYPQPVFMDIEFDELGFMIVGLGDRYGHQSGNDNADGGDPTISVGTVEGVSAGDMLRLEPAGGTWILENNATSGGAPPTGGAGNGEGPGGGEYYFHDRFPVLGGPTHDEITLGGLASIPGRGELVVSVFDPPPANQPIDEDNDPTTPAVQPFRSGGVAWFSHATGERTRSYMVYPLDADFTFGKASGIGDMEVFCGPAPIEIGNIVWEDLDRNGQQDPGEAKLAGVTLNLYIDTDFDGTAETLLANTVTDALGEYYFNEANILDDVGGALVPGLHFFDSNNNGLRDPNEPAGVLPNRTYRVALDSPVNYGGGPLTNYFITPNDTALIAQNADIRDSDGVPTGDFLQLASMTNFPQVTLTTGDFGNNNHTYDFGFALDPPEVPTETPTPTSTATPDAPPPDITPGAPGTPGVPSIPPDPVPPGLALDKIANPPFAQPGDIVTWTVTISNPSGATLPVGEVIDNIPAELVILSAESSPGTVTIDGRSVIVSIASLGPGQSATVTITTRIRDDVEVPFVITNVIGDASASVISVSRLPDTGE